MIGRLLFRVALFVYRLVSKWPKWVLIGVLALVVLAPFAGIIYAKFDQYRDRDDERGAIAVPEGEFGESYAVPEYLDQGWDANDSLWYYNTTQGSALLPYDFLLVLEQSSLRNKEICKRNGEEAAWFLCDKVIDHFRYLPQKDTIFNPDALPVGFTKETYQDKDYVGYTCAACHTAQINFKNPGDDETRALRIDGGPAMADMAGFLVELARSMKLTRGVPDRQNPRLDRFVERVLALKNDYKNRGEIEEDLEKWTNVLALYNDINRSTHEGVDVDYGYARLDAFGRIFNRVIQHVINRDQVAAELAQVTVKTGNDVKRLLSDDQIAKVLDGDGKPGDAVGKFILRDEDFAKIVNRLQSKAPGYPHLDKDQLNAVRNKIFNPPNAPVSYPFLWDITRSDYVQWNGLASNYAAGPLGRNAGEVTGVFAIIDWQKDTRWFTQLTGFSISAIASGQIVKREQIYFKSSVDLFNLQRLESHLGDLTSPAWPFCRDGDRDGDYYLPTIRDNQTVDQRDCDGDDEKIDTESKKRGRLLYADKCQGCHDVIDRKAWDRLIVSKMSTIDKKGTTDKAMAENSVNYTGKSGNIKHTYQKAGVGTLIVAEDAPVAQMLIAAVSGVVTTSDADKWWPRRIVEWVYALAMTLFDNQIKASVKSGNYEPDTTAKPFNSLLSYRARSLNGIWATAPYLHNGSVPTLYDLLLPVKCKTGVGDGKRRPTYFVVGSRTFDPKYIGFKSQGYDGFWFDTTIRGNSNAGHIYSNCRMTHEQRLDLIEYLKSL